MITLDFAQPVQQSIVDKDGQGTGFTSVQPNTAGNQLDSTRLDLDTASGTLRVTTQAGGNAASNDMKNGLQVNVNNPSSTYSAATRVMGPFTTYSQQFTQAGLFIGVDQDTYVKLVVINNNGRIILQFFREEAGVRSQIAEVRDITWANVTHIDLYLTADRASNTIRADFKTNLSTGLRTISTPFTPVANSPLFHAGVKTGILATSPGSGQQIIVPFDVFQLTESGTPSAPPLSRKIDFTTASGKLATGYTRDGGAAYASGTGFGWVTRASKEPISVANGVRVRGTSVDARLDSVAHMQYQGTDNAWEMDVPNGQYHVRVGVGDPTFFDSTHVIYAEGVKIVDGFTPTSNQKFMILSGVVNVQDSKLTLDAFGASNGKITFVEVESISPGNHPSAQTITVEKNSAGKVFTDSAISIDLNLPGGGLTAASVNRQNVILYETATGSATRVSSGVNTSGGGDVIVLTPSANLKPNTSYTFEVSSGVKDDSGNSMIPFTFTFVTASGDSNTGGGGVSNPSEPGGGVGTLPPGAGTMSFTKEKLTTAGTDAFSSLVVGPDGRLYATTLDGKIHRFTINSNGTLSSKQTYAPSSLAGRAIIGIAFEPGNPNVLWISHNDPVFPQPAPNFTGAISKLTITGNDTSTWFANKVDYITGLPRAAKDHLSNSLAFKDGKLYLSQGSTSAMGRADAAWFNREETKLSGTILEIDTTRTSSLPINVRDDSGYNANASNAPVKIFAYGVRNAYDLVWHSNGSLYVPTNGSAAGGNTPNNPGTSQNEALTKVSSQDDFLFRVERGGYYGHPNPNHGYYIMNGGNPTNGADKGEVIATPGYTGYPVGIQPEDNYRGYVANFGQHRSPNGAIEYTGPGPLNGALLVVEYSAGDDIVAFWFNQDGSQVTGRLKLMGGFINPLDIAQGPNGNLFVAEFNEDTFEGSISVIRPQ